MRVTVLIVLFILIVSLSSSAKTEGYKLICRGTVTATAYNSLASQTDSTPWITASGTKCRTGVIAANFLPFGTKVMIEGFGEQIFVVEDRMNRRYNKRIDIWFYSYKQAVQFGRRKVKYYVLET